MAKLTLLDILSGYSVLSKYNSNNTLIEQALENTLSRDGTSPNSMNANLDMNSKRVLNLPGPANENEPARLLDVQNALGALNGDPVEDANLVLIADGDDFFDANNVEGALQEIGTLLSSAGFLNTTAAETAAGVTPTDLQYAEGNPRRYGAVGDGVANDTTPVQNALSVIKATYVHANTTSKVWALNPGDVYNITSSLHFGSTTETGGRIKFFQGNGAKFVCNHTGIGVDLTNADGLNTYDLWITNGAAIPKILLLQCRFSDTGSQGMRQRHYGLRLDGVASICGLFNYGSESNSFFHPQIAMTTSTPFSWIISDSGRYCAGHFTVSGATSANPIEFTTSEAHGFSTNDLVSFDGLPGNFGTNLDGNEYSITVTGATTFTIAIDGGAYAAYTSGGVAAKFVNVVPFIPNMDAGDPVLPGISTTNNHMFAAWVGNTTTFASGGRGAVQFVGGGRHTFEGFVNINDAALRAVTSVDDNAGGGDPVLQLKCYGLNLHVSNDVAWEHIAGTLNGLELFSQFTTGSTIADFRQLAGTMTEARIDVEKIIFNGTLQGNNQLFVGTSLTALGTIEGDVYLSDAATITLSGNGAQKRCRIHDSDSGRTYNGIDTRSFSSVSTSGTGEDQLASYSITGSTGVLGAAGRGLRIKAAGTKTGANGNKTIKLHLGATAYTVFPAANDQLAWAIEADLYTSASNAQALFIKGYQNSTLVYAKYDTAAIDLTATTTLKITGECANAADLITQQVWVVEQD